MSNYILIPELQYWMEKTITNSTLNKNSIKRPTSIPSDKLPSNSFIELLFNEDWDKTKTTFSYLYYDLDDRKAWPTIVKSRLLVYPTKAKYYVCGSDSTNYNINVFALEAEELSMLSLLLQYRLLNIIGQTMTIDADFTTLTSNLSKMIYYYLDFKINDYYQDYSADTIVISNNSSPRKILDKCYESYLIDQLFKHLMIKNAF